MDVKKIVIFLTCITFNLCNSWSVESLKKCSLKDHECLRTGYAAMLKSIAKNGLPEYGIPAIDPVVLKNVSVSVLDLVDLTMVDGVAKGIKNCIINSFKIEIEKELGSQDITCDVLIKGHYSLSANSTLVRELLGAGDIQGDGNGKVQLEKLHLSLNYPFYPERHPDGEIYMKAANKDIRYKYDVQGKATFAADSIYLGKENVSEFVIKYLNDNGKFLIRTMGKAFIDRAMEFYFDFAEKFFYGVPAKYYILEDLSPYIKN